MSRYTVTFYIGTDNDPFDIDVQADDENGALNAALMLYPQYQKVDASIILNGEE